MPRSNSQTHYFALAGIALGIATSLTFLTPDSSLCANPNSCRTLPTYEANIDQSAIWQGNNFLAPNPPSPNLAQVLGQSTTTNATKHIYVDLEKQLLKAYDGDTLYMEARVSTGKWGRTPKGEFKIWSKFTSTRMSGGQGNDYYNLPNVPYTMFFYNDKVSKSAGFALHGAYWHNNFGHPMSHGCVNLRTIDAEKLFLWATPTSSARSVNASLDNPGTNITIF